MLTFILGGARSGKSRHAQALAEGLAEAGGDALVFIATAQTFDAEMRDRIARHRADRDDRWRTVEAPIDLCGAIRDHAAPGRVLLIDCLTLWMSNVLLAGEDAGAMTNALLAALTQSRCPIVVVSNEVGLGIVPDNALARRFRDLTGRLHQNVATAATRVDFMVAGLSLRMK